MPKSLLFLLVLFFSISVFSQNATLRGKVVEDKTQLPLESATVYLTRVSDSTVIDYTITDKNGAFVLKTRKLAKPVKVKISFVGFQTFERGMKSVDDDFDLGTVSLADLENKLGELVLKSEAPPVRIKNDTLEFNASSFKLRPDANVESLLKQLPGVEIDEEGKIKVNGKEVNQILVNGKPFFDKDGKVALQNLPSDIINKVQVTDLKTKAEEISGNAATSDKASINLTIDEDKNKGLFGKFTGGYGTNDRYEGSLLLNYFKGDQKISVLGSANNINSTGFSMNEIFDNMGGGRNNSLWMDNNGGFSIGDMRFGGRGITRSSIFGANYADNYFKKLDVNGSYFYTAANSQNTNRTNQLNFLPEGNYRTESSAISEDDKFAHNYNFTFEYKIDSTTTLSLEPRFTKAFSSFKNKSEQASSEETGELLNQSSSDNISDSDKFTFGNSGYFYKALKRKGREIGISLANENNNSNNRDLNRSNTTFYRDTNNDGIPDTEEQDNRDQIRRQRTFYDSYSLEAEYTEPVTDSLNLNLRLQYAYTKKADDKKTFDFDPATDDYSELNELLSMYMASEIRKISPGVGIQYTKKKFNMGASFYTQMTTFSNRGDYLGDNIKLDKKYILPHINGYLSYRFTKTRSTWVSYNYNVDLPEAFQVLPIENLSNPLHTFTGNPNLEPWKRHYAYVNFRDYDYSTKSGYTLYFGGSYYDTQIVAYSTYDQSRKRTTSYVNVPDTYNLWYGANWSKSLKREAHSYKVSFSLNGGLDKNRGYVNGERYDARSASVTPRVNFTYDYGELLTINPSYRFTYSDTHYKNYLIEKASNVVHSFGLQTTSYWPKNVVLGNDINYNYNSNIADGFKKDFYLWNISLGYNFFEKKLLAKVKVYDVLDQNQSATRTIGQTFIRDEENIVLKRYAMFSLTYKLEKFGGKKKEESRMFFHD